MQLLLQLPLPISLPFPPAPYLQRAFLTGVLASKTKLLNEGNIQTFIDFFQVFFLFTLRFCFVSFWCDLTPGSLIQSSSSRVPYTTELIFIRSVFSTLFSCDSFLHYGSDIGPVPLCLYLLSLSPISRSVLQTIYLQEAIIIYYILQELFHNQF